MADFVKEFHKELAQAARAEGKREYDAFEEWLELAFTALSAPVWKMIDRAKFDEGEARYLKRVSRLRDPETISRYGKLTAIVVGALEDTRRDVLSSIFMEVAANAHIGQFFTPPELCRLMAEMTCVDGPELLREARRHGRSYITLQEPAAGAGGMILATSETLARQGLDPARHQHWVAIDVDIVACRAAYIQMTLMGISGVVIHGNTLTLDEWSATPTLTAVLFPKKEAKSNLREVVMDDGRRLTVRVRERVQKVAAE